MLLEPARRPDLSSQEPAGFLKRVERLPPSSAAKRTLSPVSPGHEWRRVPSIDEHDVREVELAANGTIVLDSPMPTESVEQAVGSEVRTLAALWRNAAAAKRQGTAYVEQ